MSSGFFASWVVPACLCLGACQAPAPASRTSVYGSSAQIGTWEQAGAGAAGNGGYAATGAAGSTAGNQGKGNAAAGAGAAGVGAGGIAGSIGVAGTGGVAGGAGAAGTRSSAGSGGSAGAAGAGGAGGTGGTTSGTYTSITFDVLTHAQGGGFLGCYSPNNVGAIWIETASGAFVKTLAHWALIRANYLTKYIAETKSDTADVVTSATITSHVTHSVTWKLKDASGMAVPDGDYKIIVEVTECDSTGQFTTVPFTKNSALTTMSPPDTKYFTAMKITAK